MSALRILASVIMAVVLMVPAASQAQDMEKTFAVVPFSINGPDKYQYLSRGVQDMLISRLSWENHFQHIGKDKIGDTAAPASDAEAETTRAALGSDYLVWGSITILGEQCSVDVRTTGPEGTAPASDQVALDGLIPSLEKIAGGINASVFERPETAQAAEPVERVNRLNPELIHNETSATQEFYLNPQFRYAGGTDTPGRWRSPSMPFASNAMLVADVDNDGNNEMLFISEHRLFAYRVTKDEFRPLDDISPGGRSELLSLDVMDLNRDGWLDIIISGFFEDAATSYILTFKNGKFEIVEKNIPFFLNVVEIPPLYKPILVGQRTGDNNLLAATVHEMVKIGGKYKLGKRVPLPETANAFNFAYLPVEGDQYKLLVVNNEDRIEVYTPTLDLQATTFDQFAGSPLGFAIPDTFKGFESTADQFVNYYYIPLRLVITDVDGNGVNEIIVNKNISTAAQFFKSYRYFPNGELHALFWDNVGLSLAWKTRRIKGSVADYGVADLNNDGTMELFVCINTHPGASGLRARRTTVISYAIDTSKADPNKVNQVAE